MPRGRGARRVGDVASPLVDCGVGPKGAYVDEIAGFTNIAQLCVSGANDDIRARVAGMNAAGVRAVVSVQSVLFDAKPDTSTGSGTRLTLRADYAKAWST